MKNYSHSVLRVLSLALIVLLGVSMIYVSAEPQISTAASDFDAVIVTLDVVSGISITNAPNTSMSTSLGVAANTAVGTTTWNVKTNNALGYAMTVAASTNPAMQSGSNTIADYATTTNPSLWSISAGTAKFGFSAFGTDTSTATWGTGSFCNGAATSTISTSLKYYGFYTAATTTSTRAATTTTAGIDTTVCYAVEQNGFYIPSGTYTATITATATTL